MPEFFIYANRFLEEAASFLKMLFLKNTSFFSFSYKVGKKYCWNKPSMFRYVFDALIWPLDLIKVLYWYRCRFGIFPNLFLPETFNEKIQWNKLFNRRSFHTRIADKIAVREYVSEKIGPEILTKIYWVGQDLKTVSRELLPAKFVIKPNHLSGKIIFAKDKNLFDWEEAYLKTSDWLKIDYSRSFGEWQYRWIMPKIYIEEYLEAINGERLVNYKFYCFNGKVEVVLAGRIYDRNFDEVKLRTNQQYREKIRRPDCFEAMRSIAERLSEGKTFVRVDLYDIGRPVFGELTLSPQAGYVRFDPPEWNVKFGRLMCKKRRFEIVV